MMSERREVRRMHKVQGQGITRRGCGQAAWPPGTPGLWHLRRGSDRLAAVEAIRQTLYGYSSTSPGLQRFFEIAQREKSGL